MILVNIGAPWFSGTEKKIRAAAGSLSSLQRVRPALPRSCAPWSRKTLKIPMQFLGEVLTRSLLGHDWCPHWTSVMTDVPIEHHPTIRYMVNAMATFSGDVLYIPKMGQTNQPLNFVGGISCSGSFRSLLHGKVVSAWKKRLASCRWNHSCGVSLKPILGMYRFYTIPTTKNVQCHNFLRTKLAYTT